jgi:hypothetical protein
MSKEKTKGDEDKLARIHFVLNEYDGDEALKRIREILYGFPPVEPGDKEEEESDG